MSAPRLVRFRSPGPDDMEYIRATWLSSYRMSHHAGPIPVPWWRRWFAGGQRECEACGATQHEDGILDWIMAREPEFLVAFKPGEAPPDDVYGWICVERGVRAPVRVPRQGVDGETVWVEELLLLPQPVVHYLYVKQIFRQSGFARGLLRAAGVDIRSAFSHTFATAMSSKLRHKAPGARFDPRLVRFPKHETQDPDEESE